MANALNYLNVVLNSIAGASDSAIVQGHFLQVTGVPLMDYRSLNVPTGGAGPLVSLVEVVSSYTVTPTPAANTEYILTVAQTFAGQGVTTEVFSYTTGSSAGTATAWCDAFREIIALNENIDVTLSGTATLIIAATAGVGASILTVSLSTTSVSLSAWVASTYATIAVASNTTAPATVITTSAPHGLAVNQTVTISGSSNTTNLPNGTYVVASVPSATTLTLMTANGVPLAGTATATATITLVPQFPRGQGQDLINAGITDAVAGRTYSTVIFVADQQDPVSNQGSEQSAINQYTLYSYEGESDYAAFRTQLIANFATAAL